MKFASLALVGHLVAMLSSNDPVFGLTVAGTMLGAIGMLSTADVKKVVAYFSVIHMSLSLLALTETVDIGLVAMLGWHHHSIVTGSVF